MPRRSPFAGALNFRDVGGYPTADGMTRSGVVFRSDSLHRLTEEDLTAFDALGIRAIFDLRQDTERAQHPGPRAHVPFELPIQGLDDFDLSLLQTREQGERFLAGFYLGILANAGLVLGALFTEIAKDANRPAVVHCLGGKDRTGMAVALLLSALGVDREIVLDDYELSTELHGPELIPEVVQAFVDMGIGHDAAMSVLGTPRWTMREALEALDDEYGGAAEYLKRWCRVADGTVGALRSALVSPD